jgi:hypothetical protein
MGPCSPDSSSTCHRRVTNSTPQKHRPRSFSVVVGSTRILGADSTHQGIKPMLHPLLPSTLSHGFYRLAAAPPREKGREEGATGGRYWDKPAAPRHRMRRVRVPSRGGWMWVSAMNHDYDLSMRRRSFTIGLGCCGYHPQVSIQSAPVGLPHQGIFKLLASWPSSYRVPAPVRNPPHTFVAGISTSSIDSSWGGIAGRTDGPDVVNGTAVGTQHRHPESSWEKEDAPGPLIQSSVAGICPEMGEHRTIRSGSYGLGQAWIRRIGSDPYHWSGTSVLI